MLQPLPNTISTGGAFLHNVEFYGLTPRAIVQLKCNQKSGKLALSRSDGSIEIWDIDNKAATFLQLIPPQITGSCEGLGWVDDRLLSITSDGELLEWTSNGVIRNRKRVTGRGATCMDTFGTQVVVGTEDGYLNVFNVTEDEIVYDKMLDRQEGRVTCIRFDPQCQFVVVGAVNFVRIFELESGQVVNKMHLGRIEGKKDTIVWTLVVLDDLTVLTGDSRGRLTVWDGQKGAQIDSITASNVDVLAMAMHADGKSLYCSGMEPTIKQFNAVITKKDDVEVKQWIRGVSRNIHSHDVLAMDMYKDKVVAGGIDGYLSVSSYPPKVISRYPPVLRQSASAGKDFLLLIYPTYLEVWRLGKVGDRMVGPTAVEIRTQPEKFIVLRSKKDAMILDAKISPNGQYIAYTSLLGTKLFKFDVIDDKPSLEPIPLPETLTDVHQLVFTSESYMLYCIKTTNTVDVYNIRVKSINSFEIQLGGMVRLAEAAPLGTSIAFATTTNEICIWSRKGDKWRNTVTLPTHKCPPTCIKFTQKALKLIVVYADMKYLEYNLAEKRYDFSTVLNAKPSPMPQNYPVRNVLDSVKEDGVVVLQTEYGIFSLRKLNEDEAEEDLKSRKKKKTESGEQKQVMVKIKQVKLHEHVVHLATYGKAMTAVLLSYAQLIEQLPPPMKKKRYGVS